MFGNMATLAKTRGQLALVRPWHPQPKGSYKSSEVFLAKRRPCKDADFKMASFFGLKFETRPTSNVELQAADCDMGQYTIPIPR